jgi:site-specific recombinase XerD
MKKIVSSHGALSRLHEGPLGSYIDSYLELLNEQGFTQESVEDQIRLITGFSRWLDENGYKAEDVSQEKADQFLKFQYLRPRPPKRRFCCFAASSE